MQYNKNKNHGFTLVETLVGVAVFLIVSIAAYNAYIGLFKLINVNKYKLLAINLANEQFEIAKNMPYKDIGIVQGIPVGLIPRTQTLSRGGVNFTVDSIVRNIDLPFDGTIGGIPNDLSPADNKLLQITVSCPLCSAEFAPITLTGRIAPKNLETASNNGALFIKVFDANGQPIQNVNVHIVNVATSSNIIVDDITDQNGMLQIVDIPPDQNAYRISVSKTGYSSDRTYPLGGSANPYPLKTDASVVVGQVTQVSFSIDRLSTMNFLSQNSECQIFPNYNFNISGSKTVGQDVLKYYSNKQTNSNGALSLNDIEWDTYTIENLDSTLDLVGINPIIPITVNPNSTQDISLILKSKNPRTLLVNIKDSSTGLPLSDVTVNIEGGSINKSLITGKGYIAQTDWSQGKDQADFVDSAKYFNDNGNIDANSSVGNIKLLDIFGHYADNGVLESSTFDLGTNVNFGTLTWSPKDIPEGAGNDAIRLQFASNKENTPTTTWTFMGPDGTSNSYYKVSDTSISNIHNSDRYARYKLYISTETATVTPMISDIAFTYTTACTPPGQVSFQGLQNLQYTIRANKTGYQNFEQTIDMDSNWKQLQVNMIPE